MPSDEGDSGVEAMSTPESRESSPKSSEIKPQPLVEIPNLQQSNEPEIEEEEPDETLTERLIGLTEMFPESLRNGVCSLVSSSKSGMGSLYGFSRAALWIFFSSSAILVAPVIFEMERLQMDEMQKQQQRQILLGPSAAVAGGMGGPPGMGVPQPPRS